MFIFITHIEQFNYSMVLKLRIKKFIVIKKFHTMSACSAVSLKIHKKEWGCYTMGCMNLIMVYSAHCR